MHRAPTVLVLLAAAAGLGGPARIGAADAPRSYELPNLDLLELPVPGGWQDRIEPTADGSQPLIQFSDPADTSFSVEVEPLPDDPASHPAPDAETLRESVRLTAERLGSQSLEKSVDIRRLQGASGVGFYFRATASAPESGEPPCMTQGALQVGRLTVWFTILTPDERHPAIARALAMLTSAGYRGTGLDQH